MLDSGEAFDKHLKRNVDFTGAWIIFTTNLGRELFDKATPLGDNAAVSAEAFDLLASAKARTEQKDEEAVPVLSPEFISRISKGGAVIFSRLEARHLLELVDQGLRNHEPKGAQVERVLPQVSAELEAQVLFLLSLLPNLEARKVVSRSRAWAMDLIRGTHDELREDLAALGSRGFELRVALAPQASAFLQARLDQATQSALLIDEDQPTFQLLEGRLAMAGTTLERCTGIEALKQTLDRNRPAFILLDLSIYKGPASSDVGQALAILEYLRTRHSELPVYVFSENPDRRTAFASIAERILRKGGARDFIPYFRNSNHAILEEAFASRVMEITHSHRLEVLFRNQERGHVQVHFEPSFSLDAATATVRVSLDNATEAVVVGAQDQAAGIGFAGIPKERFSDVVGLDRAKERLGFVLQGIRDPRTLRKLGGDLPRGYLLAGPPGCGKTMLARAFAGEAGLPFLALAGGELTAKWLGETEQKIRDLFDMARKYAPAIIFIDEIESIAPDRATLPDTTPWMVSIVNQLLSCMDGFKTQDAPVVVLAATNHPDQVDPAIRRPGRFDEVIPLDFPSFKARLAFFTKRLERVPRADGVDLEDLAKATVGRTPAYLDRLVREAIYLAAKDGREQVSQQDFQDAKHFVLYGADLDLDLSPEELELTAHHEAGHAIARLVLFPKNPIDLITITPSEGGSLGFVASHRPENQHSLSLQEIEDELTVLISGREAERRLRGDKGITTGASNDLERASTLARQAVTEWGLDDQLGPLVTSQAGGTGGIDASERVKVLLLTAQARSRALLASHQGWHLRVVQELLSQQSIKGSVAASLAD